MNKYLINIYIIIRYEINRWIIKSKRAFRIIKGIYEANSDKNILTYKLDEKLSNLYGKVYVDNINKKVVLAHRGTESENMGSDWTNNLIYASSSAYKLTSRFKIAKKMVDGAL